MSILQFSILKRKKQLVLLILMSCFVVIGVNAQTPNFNYTISKKCAPTLVKFTNNTSALSGASYMWDFGKGAVVFSDEKELQEVYSEPGTYTVTLSRIIGTDTVSLSKTLSVLTGPAANFSISDSVGCVPKLITMTDESTPGDGAINSYFWDLKNGSTYTDKNPQVNFTLAGDYSIYFKVVDENLCSDFVEYTSKINLNKGPLANFTTSEDFSCNPPLRVNFTNTSTGTGSLDSKWNFGNGIQSTNLHDTLTYIDYGDYSVSLEVSDEFGCTSTVNKVNHIRIGGGAASITATSEGNQYLEDSVLFCPGDVMFVTDLSPSAINEWVVSYNGVEQVFAHEDTLVFNFPDSGMVRMELYYGQGTACPDTLIKTYFIDWIESDFELDNYTSCRVPVDISTINNSLNAVLYSWMLPDGAYSSDVNVNYTIPSELSYYQEYNHHVNNDRHTFRLVATNGNGCNDTLYKDFTTHLPVARFMPDVTSGCIPLDVTFYDESLSEEEIDSWEYYIDGVKVADNDGTPYKYTFTSPGVYAVEMVIRNSSMCYDTSYAVSIHVGDIVSPTFTLSASEVCPGEGVTISNTTAVAPGVYAWSYSVSDVFHSGELLGNSAIFSAKTDDAGDHDVYLTANYNGCYSSDTLFDGLKINGPSGSFIEYINCETPLDYTFVSEMDLANTLVWELDGQTYNNVDTVKYNFPGNGDYMVKLTGTQASSGCVLEKSKLIKVREVEAIIEEQPYACLGDDVLFKSNNSSNYINTCYQEGFLWNFGDGTPPRRTYETSYLHTYTDTGTYAVKLYALADNGCVDSVETEIKIATPFPEIAVDKNKGCAPEMVVNFQYSNHNSEISSWEWFYGDGGIEQMGLNVEHTYRAGSSHTFYSALVATDIYGCVGFTSMPLTYTKPNADFRAFDNSICLGDQAAFYTISQTHDSLLFQFGDGNSSVSSLRHEYEEKGRYDVSLTVYEEGCESTFLRPEYILVDGVSADFSISETEVDCYPATIGFTHLFQDHTIVDGNWDFGDGSESGFYSGSVQYTYTQPGEYTVTLQALTANQCVSQKSKKVTVNGPRFEFGFSPERICSGEEVQFAVLDTLNVDSFEWIFGDGNTSGVYEPVHTYLAYGNVVPAISVTNNNCQVLIVQDTLKVSSLMADFTLEGERELCAFENFSALNTSRNYQSSKWFVNNQEVSSENDFVYVLMEEGVYNIKLEVTDVELCVDTVTETLSVWANPEFDIIGDRYVCPGSQAELSVAQSESDWSIQWSPSEMVSSANSFNVITAIEESTLIQALVTNSHQCSVSKSVLINVGDAIEISRVPVFDTSIYIGQDLDIILSSGNTGLEYSWEPNYNISCTNCPSPTVWPQEPTSYTLTVSDSCTSQVLVFPVEVIIDYYLEFPDAFSPNFDGENDEFVYEYHNVGEVDFKIYNRWGNLVFKSNTVGEGWDGMFQGSVQNIDTYSFYVRAKTIHGYEFERKGTFMLLK